MTSVLDYSFYDREEAIYKAALDLLDAEYQVQNLSNFRKRTTVTFDVDNQQIRIVSLLDADVVLNTEGATLTVKERGIDEEYEASHTCLREV